MNRVFRVGKGRKINQITIFYPKLLLDFPVDFLKFTTDPNILYLKKIKNDRFLVQKPVPLPENHLKRILAYSLVSYCMSVCISRHNHLHKRRHPNGAKIFSCLFNSYPNGLLLLILLIWFFLPHIDKLLSLWYNKLT